MKFSLRLNNDRPMAEYLQLAKAAESGSFDQFWVTHDLFQRSAPIILTAVAGVTERLKLGTAIVNPYTINPAELAMLAATLDEASNGRFILGLGSGAGDFLKWIGIEQKLPLTAVKETTEVIRRLLAGERAALDGRFMQWTDQAYLRFKPGRQIPIYLGAMGPKMLTAIGEWADGGLPLLFPPEHYTTVLPYIQNGAQEAGRSLDDIDIAGCVWCSVSEDRQAAQAVLKGRIAYYGYALGPMIWGELGLHKEDFAQIEQAMVVENNPEKAKSFVTEDMLAVGVVGGPIDLIHRIEQLAALGVQHISLGPPLGPDPLVAVEVIGREVIPYFR
ncbi:MAG: LLM class flavin-dependent oxidoreductase [Anaerolineae bacterium]|nr:LLM class flavin-dependent oxidoreductase [Anaerolineae bacterium]